MAVTVSTMRSIITDVILHVGSSTFDNDKIDYSIQWAGRRFLKETKSNEKTGDVTLSADDTVVDVTATLSDFLPGRMIHPPYIDSEDRYLKVVSLANVVALRQNGDVTATPEIVAFRSKTKMELYPTVDATYTLAFTYWGSLDSFTVGGAGAETLSSIADDYVHEVAIGAAAHLIRGAPGHPDSQALMAEFKEAIERAKGELTDPGYIDGLSMDQIEAVYTGGGRI